MNSLCNCFPMENHPWFLKVTRLLPSSLISCSSRSMTDVAEGSISDKVCNENEISLKKDVPSFSSSSQNLKVRKRNLIPDQGKKCPPVSSLTHKKNDGKQISECSAKLLNRSSSFHSGWFSSSEDNKDAGSEAFFSMTSFSGDSFRLKTSQRFRRSCKEMIMESIDESSRYPKDKTNAGDGKRSGKIFPECELGSDCISPQLYYGTKRLPPRRTAKNRKETATRSANNVRRLNKDRGDFKYRRVIEDSYALSKRSNDPRGDFRVSMLEMIVEKQMFGAEELKRLLLCFLSLNKAHYHGIIYEVFTEICETLLTNE